MFTSLAEAIAKAREIRDARLARQPIEAIGTYHFHVVGTPNPYGNYSRQHCWSNCIAQGHPTARPWTKKDA